MHDRYARRIDRFFDWNPGSRAIPSDPSLFRGARLRRQGRGCVPAAAMLDDPEETVRWSAVRRLPPLLLRLRQRSSPRGSHPGRATARRPRLISMVPKDVDYFVRQTVARRIPDDLLVLMIGRRRCGSQARRGQPYCPQTAAEDGGRQGSSVRLEVARRDDPANLAAFASDVDWRIRYEASRCAQMRSRAMVDNDDDRRAPSRARSNFRRYINATSILRFARRNAVSSFGGRPMTNISRDSHVVELDDAPAYNYGDKVNARQTIRNDGTSRARTSGTSS